MSAERNTFGGRAARFLFRLAERVTRLEKGLLTVLVGAMAGLIIFNVVTRFLGAAMFWVDELAIYAMAWSALLGTCILRRRRQNVAVTFLTAALSADWRRRVALFREVLVGGMAVWLLVLCWLWFSPGGWVAAGFDAAPLAARNVTYIYSVSTNTLGIGKVWIWLILPWFAVSHLLHTLVNIMEVARDDA